MATEDELLEPVLRDPRDTAARMVYADWLEERGDRRCHFVRTHGRIAHLPPDHPDRRAGEDELSVHRAGLDESWLAMIEPERRRDDAERGCGCLSSQKTSARTAPMTVPVLHREPQDTQCEAWRKLCAYVERCAGDHTLRFQPRPELTAEEWRQIVTLPPTIAKLTNITSLDLYGSHLVRLPPEIGAMTSLRSFTPYTSYQLHWFPYEITRCPNLVSSTVSTRAVYGNFKFRSPFPALEGDPPAASRPCSVCDRPFEDRSEFRLWISLRVGTDVLPLLVNACSAECVARLPAPPENYVAGPHRGGAALEQPAPMY